MKEETDYNKQANEFLKKTDTTFKAEFVKHGKHFDDDKDNRDIYQITLKRGEREFKFNFGQSINDSGLRLFHKGSNKRTNHKPFSVPQNIRELMATAETPQQKTRSTYRFKDWFEREHFNLGGLSYDFGEVPTPYDVLASLTDYPQETFKDFCDNFGYDEDSRKAEKTYKAVVEEYKNVCMLWNESELEQLREIN